MDARRTVVLAAIVTAIGGCYAHAEPVGYAEVTAAPVGIEASPYIYYEGRPVYYYGDRWYYRDGDRWRYYRQPPPDLVRQRPYVQQAPPAPRVYPRAYPSYGPGYGPGYAPPPAPAPQVAPPAVRTQ